MNTLSLSISEKKLAEYVAKQLNNYFPDDDYVSSDIIDGLLPHVLGRIERCFNAISLPYYRKQNAPFFNHLHSDHYGMFLYVLSRVAYEHQLINVASKVFFLNKAMVGVDAFYEVKLPEIFLFVHPIGTILGRGTYSDYFVVYQGVTIGANAMSQYPSFSPRTILFSNSSIIGSSECGADFILGAKASLIDANIPSKSIVVGNYPQHRVLSNKNNLIQNYFSYE